MRESRLLTIPAASSVAICSLLALAVTAMMGTWRCSLPAFSSSRILLVQARPSMTGISLSMSTTSMSMASGSAPFQNCEAVKRSSASPPWLATSVMMPRF
jgi:hypothetical protein